MAEPIFILGITGRSGTNFLRNLLCLHPECAPVTLPEDHLLAHGQMLVRYAAAVRSHWDGRAPGAGEALTASLAEGLLSFLRLQAEPGRRPVTKTPSVHNLGLFFRLFPQAHLLILVRDGRAVAESSARSFEAWSRERMARQWARGAREILRFLADPQSAGRRYLVVRYEDLHGQTETELRRILGFLGLDAERYDFQAAARLPVVGSSSLRGGREDVHWEPLEKTPEFDPIGRFEHWTRAMHERFNWIAGDLLEPLGYVPVSDPGRRPLWAAWNLVQDALGWGRARLRRIRRRPEGGAGGAPRGPAAAFSGASAGRSARPCSRGPATPTPGGGLP